MDFLNFKSLDIKRKIGCLQVFLFLLLMGIFIPFSEIEYSNLLLILFLFVVLFRWNPVPLRKYSYLSLTNAISILMFLLYGPVTAAFWIFIFLSVADIIFKKGVFQSIVNGSAYALSTLIAGKIAGSGILLSPARLMFFFIIHYILQNGIFFYLHEFISRKADREEIIYIHTWEVFYYIIAAVSALLTYYVIKEAGFTNTIIFLAGFFTLRWFIRKFSSDAIEGAIHKKLINLQSSVMKRSFEETLEAVKEYSEQYVDWTGMNILQFDRENNEITLIYSTNETGEEGFKISTDRGISGKCIREREPVIVRDTGDSEIYVPLREGVRSEMAIPLISGGRVLGVLDLEHDIEGAFSEKEIEYANFFASQLAYAFETNILLQPLVSTSGELRNFTDDTYKTTEDITEEMKSIQEIMNIIQKGGEEQLDALEKVENALSNLLSSHENIKTLRQEMSESMGKFEGIIEESRKSIKENLTRLNDITESTKNVEETVKLMEKLSQGVMGIAESSKEVAEDTSLLALNASIEAVKEESSKEAFGVIANEINKLSNVAASNSDEISIKAKDIIHGVDEMASRTENVVKSTENIGIASSEIMEHFESIGLQLKNIQVSMKETIEVSDREISSIEALSARLQQSEDIGNSNISEIENIGRLISSQNTIVENLKERVISLKDATERLTEIVDKFKLRR